MKIKKLLKVLLFIVAAIVIIKIMIYYRIPSPKEIYVYRNGYKVVVEKNSPKFNEVVRYTRQRYKLFKYRGKGAVEDNIKEQELVLEFIYDKKYRIARNDFVKILFPLKTKLESSNYNEEMYFANELNSNYYVGGIGPLKHSNKLIDVLINISE
ncbi:hypothetical protein [Desnuesiella massiliensis]|uniref:hypothetical protein n=1 Tax=Desnuesiella massiliensis TaxID=1650662 RepID=UPI0006E3F171|nr:hypothetical protein [Desnuesiella massiliensis]